MGDVVADLLARIRQHGGPHAKLHNPWRGKGVSDEEIAAMTKPHLDRLDSRADVLAKDLEKALKPISINDPAKVT